MSKGIARTILFFLGYFLGLAHIQTSHRDGAPSPIPPPWASVPHAPLLYPSIPPYALGLYCNGCSRLGPSLNERPAMLPRQHAATSRVSNALGIHVRKFLAFVSASCKILTGYYNLIQTNCKEVPAVLRLVASIGSTLIAIALTQPRHWHDALQ